MPFGGVYIRSTSQASTSQGSLRNERTRNCSTPNTKIDLVVWKGPPRKTETIADP